MTIRRNTRFYTMTETVIVGAMERSRETKEETSNSNHMFSYGSDEVKSFAAKNAKLKNAFLDPTIGSFLRKEAPGKRILDIGCGTGDWCYQAAHCGAKNIDGFDKQEKMVELAKQATSPFNTVSIQLGDIKNMPYNDNTFDIALSIFVTCELPIEMISKHFNELFRVLVPGGKALVLNLSNPAFQLCLTERANEAVVQEKIDQILAHLPDHPSSQQISSAFEDLQEAMIICFAYDKNGSLFQVKDPNQLVNGQAVVLKTFVTTFPDFYYDDQFLIDQTTAAGLRIDQIENVFTEERRLEHNRLNPQAACKKEITEHPYCLLYHISKPT